MHIVSVKLLTHALERQLRFYTETLELPLMERTATSFTVQAGSSCLTFERVADTDAGAAAKRPFYHYAFDIPSNRIDASAAWLDSRGIALNPLPDMTVRCYSATWDATSIYYNDPAGNIVEFIARHTIANRADGPFTARDLLHISEIGLVARNVSAMKRQLADRLKIEDYKDSSEQFAAVGDERGLFILSAYERIWLGSRQAAQLFSTEVRIKGAAPCKLAWPEYPYRIYSE